MTEEEWLTTEDDLAMLRHVQPTVPLRKLRLVLCEVARIVCERVPYSPWEAAIEVATRLADGRATADELEQERGKRYKIFTDEGETRRVLREVCRRTSQSEEHLERYSMLCALPLYLDHMLQNLAGVAGWRGSREVLPTGRIAQIFREILGNPFRPVAFAPSWRTETAVALAAGIYAERAFDRLPILADALEEAGCDHADVLNHCRGPGPHARGCWVVDGVLGRQ